MKPTGTKRYRRFGCLAIVLILGFVAWRAVFVNCVVHVVDTRGRSVPGARVIGIAQYQADTFGAVAGVADDCGCVEFRLTMFPVPLRSLSFYAVSADGECGAEGTGAWWGDTEVVLDRHSSESKYGAYDEPQSRFTPTSRKVHDYFWDYAEPGEGEFFSARR